MRQFVEKLAIVSKKEGHLSNYGCEVKDIRWSLTIWDGNKNLCVKLIKEDRLDSIKIYEDEYDLLKSVNDYLRNLNQDYIIEKLNNLQ